MSFIIENPPDFTDREDYQRFNQMVRKFETLDQSFGKKGTMMWIKDYKRYLANPDLSILDYLLGFSDPVSEPIDSDEPLDMSKFKSFITTEPYDAWESGVRYKIDANNKVTITAMMLMVGYKRINSLHEKAKLLPICRQIAAEYPDFQITPFDTDAELVDVILGVPKTTINTIVCTIAAIGIVFFVFTCNLCLTIVAVLSISSISTGMLGFMYYWGCNFDPLTMVAAIMSTGLGVDYTVHILTHYFSSALTSVSKKERIAKAVEGYGLPMLEAAISTFLVMFPVLFAPVGAYVVMAKAVVLTVIFGLLHGLLFIPVLITLLPNCLTNQPIMKCCQ